MWFLLPAACCLLFYLLFLPSILDAAKEDKTADVVEATSKAIVNIKTEEW